MSKYEEAYEKLVDGDALSKCNYNQACEIFKEAVSKAEMLDKIKSIMHQWETKPKEYTDWKALFEISDILEDGDSENEVISYEKQSKQSN